MRLQFERQQFQEDAAKAVVSLFEGVPKVSEDSLYSMDVGRSFDGSGDLLSDYEGVRNTDWQNYISLDVIKKRVHALQHHFHLVPSNAQDFNFSACPGQTLNLTIEMETGVGKTYTYIKTIHELYEAYGWSKFVIVVPSIAIREGVKKSFEVTEEHFDAEYNHPKIHFFIYSSQQLQDVDTFAVSRDIEVMIINVQAFNRTDETLIFTNESDRFGGRAPIEVICKTRPIMIFDEPQSYEGKKTRDTFERFKPLMILRYSATHAEIYNMIYRLDAFDAYNMHLVKKIAVKAITIKGNQASSGYVYLEAVLPREEGNPVARVNFYQQKKDGSVKAVTRLLEVQDDLFEQSNSLPAYHDGYVIKEIAWAGSAAFAPTGETGDSLDEAEEENVSLPSAESYIVFTNGLTLRSGEISGNQNTDLMQRRIQIHETIATHFEREKQLFARGIKVLSLFFIDHVDKYRVYDDESKDAGDNEQTWHLGQYAEIFEEEYKNKLQEVLAELRQPNLLNMWQEYVQYLESIDTERTHAGYFSRDGKRMIDSKRNRDKMSDDVSAYDLIMKDKERLLDLDPVRSPVRFIFSHSALYEGWDNPNVFQICTLKDGGKSELRKRQEIGRGMRLCVDQRGRRQDQNLLRDEVHEINLLTVIASQSYEDFARELQSEIVADLSAGLKKISVDLFTASPLEISPQIINAHMLAPQDYSTGSLSNADADADDNAVALSEATAARDSDESSTESTSVALEQFVAHTDSSGQMLESAPTLSLDEDMAKKLRKSLCNDLGYVDKKGSLTDKYYQDRKQGNVEKTMLQTWVSAFNSGYAADDESSAARKVWDKSKQQVQKDKWRACALGVARLLDSVCLTKLSSRRIRLQNARNTLSVSPDREKMQSPEFRRLWRGLSFRSTYRVNFESQVLIDLAVKKLDEELVVTPVQYEVQTGVMDALTSREQLQEGKAFSKAQIRTGEATIPLNNHVTYDLVGNIVHDTALTRHDLIEILRKIKPQTFAKFQQNPEEFMKKAANLINEAKAMVIVDHISYQLLPEKVSFSDNSVFGSNIVPLDCSASKVLHVAKSLYERLVLDSNIERDFAKDLEKREEVALYVKLPSSFYINTPVGKYTPDWAIAFYGKAQNLRHLCFVAETKGSMAKLDLRAREKAKIDCASKHFQAVNEAILAQLQQTATTDASPDSALTIGFEVVDSVESLFKINFRSSVNSNVTTTIS